jgi:hypothetical protein
MVKAVYDSGAMRALAGTASRAPFIITREHVIIA